METRAGVARVTITPPVGIEMIGFAGRPAADGIHDDLSATALVLESAASPTADPIRLALVACDLLYLRASEVEAVQAAVAASTDIPATHVVVSCSHTHYGPLTDPTRGEGAGRVDAYLANLIYLLAGAVHLARTRLQPCRIGASTGEARIGINRRERTADRRVILGQNPAGAYDPRVVVLRIDGADGRPLAAVLNHACHPVSLGADCTHFSADFPGVARRLVEEHTGAMCLFVQGAAGNINPLLMGWDWSHIDRLGLPLGAEAVRVYGAVEPVAVEGSLGIVRSTLDLPPLLPASIEEGRTLVSTLEEERAQSLAAGRSGGAWWAEQRLERARRGLAALEGGPPVPPVRADLCALRLGSTIGLVTAPGEIFTEIGQAIVQRSPFSQTLYAGYTDGSIWYVPTRTAYAEGGYEVTHACRLAPAAGELLQEESERLLQALASSR
jgi:neutral ceramidase